MLLIFKATNHRNYAKEAVNVIMQRKYLSKRKAAQLLWSRRVNTRGLVGCNIPCDLHMEHLNRRLKTILRALEANITPAAVVKAGQALATVHKSLKQKHSH